MELFFRQWYIAVRHHATQCGQAVGDSLIYDNTYHRDFGGKLAVGKADAGKLHAGLAVVGTLCFAPDDVASVVALDGSGQKGRGRSGPAVGENIESAIITQRID